MDAYADFTEAVYGGHSIALNQAARPRVTTYNLWYEYLTTYVAQKDILDKLFAVFEWTRLSVKVVTEYEMIDLRDVEDRWNRRDRFR